ncbi:MAG TPA: TetR/AcrR family transcriptional regulator [Polyangiaceae bacterium]|nr:TetR/AcrR family transcriptional regulator [Polyangiaceae bacterium]
METPRKFPKQARSAGTVRAIVEAFAHIFTRVGPSGVNTNLVAKKAGVSIGSLYQYFPNKQALLIAAIKHLAEERLRRLAQIRDTLDGKSLETVLDEMIDVAVDLRVRDQAFDRVVIENLSHFRVLETLREVQEDFIVVLSECMARARMPGTPEEHRETSRFLYQAAFSVTLWIGYFEGPDGDPERQSATFGACCWATCAHERSLEREHGFAAHTS